MRRALLILLSVVVILAVVAAGFLAYQTIQRNRVAAEIAATPASAGVSRLDGLGVTQTLEILPLDENAAAAPQYQAEHGVSYLIKTDTATVLLDLGFNQAGSDPSPLQHNMAQLGVPVSSIDTVVISHWHPDHVGGQQAWMKRTLDLGREPASLDGKRAYLPSPMTYPGIDPLVVTQPVKIAEGVATIGSLPFLEVINLPGVPARNTEQALVVNVAGRGLVLITGCGHPTLPRLVARAQAAFDPPVIGVIGGLHLAGAPEAVVRGDIDLLQGLHVQLVGLSPHDSDAPVLERFKTAFPAVYQDVMVGRPIRLAAEVTQSSQGLSQ